jgi:hypothetical protein
MGLHGLLRDQFYFFICRLCSCLTENRHMDLQCLLGYGLILTFTPIYTLSHKNVYPVINYLINQPLSLEHM